MNATSYKDTWDSRALSAEAAMAAVDGSTDESIVQHTGRWTADQVQAALDIGPEDRVLELGCGVGRIGRELTGRCASWTGVDISENMLRHARERLADRPNAHFHQLNRSKLEMLEDASIDKAYSIAVFCHMDKEDLYLYLQDLHRVVRPGGLIFVETWNLVHPIGWRRWEYEPLVWDGADQKQRKDIARNQFCTPEEFELYVRKAGFQPLANYAESQSVQIVAGRDLDEERMASEHARLERDAARIAYSPLYAEFFGLFVDVIFGKITARQMLEQVDAAAPAEEVDLFRPYLLALWRKNAELWGEPPA
ncbi:class I SAM-dependent methyltransferase [Elongatibacter sediminis]|uniref:Methyltransferase domain-containing protein n=1 Tax=Elongatibacter sediminis TaxID=3119006 RepID=A0AAW9RH89_9GAMM